MSKQGNALARARDHKKRQAFVYVYCMYLFSYLCVRWRMLLKLTQTIIKITIDFYFSLVNDDQEALFYA